MLHRKLFKNITVTLLCTLVFFCIVTPFSLSFPMLSTTEIRPAAALYPSFGLVFGVWGALGCAFGNLILDIILGNSLPMSLTSFFIQFSASYLMYVLWYGINNKKQLDTKTSPPSLSKTSNILKYNILVLFCSLFTSIMIGGLIDVFSLGKLFGNTAIIVFFNHLIFGILLGLPIVALLTKLRSWVYTPKERKVKYNSVIFSNILLCLYILSSITILVYDGIYNSLPAPLFYISLCLMVLFLIFKPVSPVKDKKKSDSFIFSLNEKMVFNFTMCGVLLAIIAGLLFYEILSQAGLSQIGIWERLSLSVAIIINLYLIISAFIFRYMERQITIPINKIADAVSAYDAKSGKDSNLLIKKSCKSLLKEKSEIGDMSKAIVTMLDDIEVYTDTIRKNTEEKQRIQAQLDIASKIQSGILPHNFNNYSDMGVEIYGDMLSAKAVGGDFYDFFRVDKDSLAFVIGDVSGKGVPAALFANMAKMVIEMFVCSEKSLEVAITGANSYICQNNSMELFLTAFIAVYNTKSHTMNFVNAGHNPPIILHNGCYSKLKTKPCLMLGVFDDIKYTSDEVTLDDNDGLFMYTDGVTEATEENQKMFGEERLLKALHKCADFTPDCTLKSIQKTLNEFSKDTQQFDDITMLSFRVKRNNKLTVKADTNNLHSLLNFVEESIREKTCNSKTINNLRIIVEEIFVNICNYAYEGNSGTAEISVLATENDVEITFTDSGTPFNPLSVPAPDITLPVKERKIGGMGIYMIKNLSDSISYEYKKGKNILTVFKRLKND